jgi:UTP--glucose-1-phosphate uridylyltransferase
MLDAPAEHGGSVVGLKEVPHDLVSSYGVVAPSGPMQAGGLLPVRDLVEKPPVDQAPSDFVIIGRYVCTPAVMTEIGRLEPGAGGELQLTDALRAVAGYEPFFGLVGDELPGGLVRYDTGNPAGWLEAVIEIALRDPKLGPGVRDLIVRMVEREGFLAGA